MADYTQIGSLPFLDIDEAINYSFKHSLPFIPELPGISKHEFMLEQVRQTILYKKAYKLICEDKFLLRVVEEGASMKYQLPGPLCIKRYLNLSFTQATQVFKLLLEARSSLFEKHEIKGWIFIDEPSLGVESLEDIKRLFSLLGSFKENSKHIKYAIHYCGREPLNLTFWSQEISLSFDRDLSPFCLDEIAKKKIKLIPGVRVNEHISYQYELITPPCGLWGINDTNEVLDLIRKIS